MVTANVRGETAEKIATRLAANGGRLLRGLQGPTISPIFTAGEDNLPLSDGTFFAVSIGVPKSRIYEAVKEIRKQGVVVSLFFH